MHKTARQNSAASPLYPAAEAFDRRMLDVGDGHTIYVEQCGNPDGVPVVVLHGGPGGGCGPYMRRFFHPEAFRVILFDQRGCGKSQPHASIDDNTTWHLIRDIELIRGTLGIDHWHAFGGSWGATLALIYAQQHPDRVLSLILRGVFLMRQQELDAFYGGAMARFWPEEWHSFANAIPEAERHDMIAAYHRRLFSGDTGQEVRFARLWSAWENALASVNSTGSPGHAPDAYARAFARLENHYFINRGWLDDDTDILNRMDRIRDIPGVIVQGRQDMVCPPVSAHDLAQAWPGGRLRMIPAAGHAMSDAGIARALIEETDRIAARVLDA